jgi:hypothetical protein
VYLLAVFVIAAAVAPWLYLGMQVLAGEVAAFEKLARQPFHRYVNRCLLIGAVVGLWPLLRALRMCSWRELGLAASPRTRALLWRGMLFGTLGLGPVVAASLVSGARVLAGWGSYGDLLRRLAEAGATGIGVGCLEEVLFRGALYGALRRVHGVWLSSVGSSVIYAIVHFFRRPDAPERVEWSTGFETLGAMLRGFGDVGELVPGFFTLVVVGGILAWCYERSGNLYFSIATHGSWVFWIKASGYLTAFAAEGSGATWWWGTQRVSDGWCALLLVGASAALVRHLCPKVPLGEREGGGDGHKMLA